MGQAQTDIYDEIAIMDEYGVTPEQLIQVCYELNDENFGREMGGLTEAMRALGVNHGIIVTRDEEDHFDNEVGGVDVVRAWKWLAR